MRSGACAEPACGSRHWGRRYKRCRAVLHRLESLLLEMQRFYGSTRQLRLSEATIALEGAGGLHLLWRARGYEGSRPPQADSRRTAAAYPVDGSGMLEMQ